MWQNRKSETESGLLLYIYRTESPNFTPQRKKERKKNSESSHGMRCWEGTSVSLFHTKAHDEIAAFMGEGRGKRVINLGWGGHAMGCRKGRRTGRPELGYMKSTCLKKKTKKKHQSAVSRNHIFFCKLTPPTFISWKKSFANLLLGHKKRIPT